MSTPIHFPGDHPLDAAQRRGLRALVALMIPASERHGVPGADDPLIFDDILRTLRPQAARIATMLEELDAFAGTRFVDLDPARQAEVAERYRRQRSPGLVLAVNATVQCYYRDDRVMRSLDMEARPPYPKGFTVEQGDWSLLDPVRQRARLYRDPP